MKLTPDGDSFADLCQPGLAITVISEIDADLDTPVSAFLKLRDRPGGAFLFESVEGGETPSRWSFLGAGGRAVINWRLGDAGDPFEDVRRHLTRYSAPSVGDVPPFTGGLVGFVGYDCVRLIEPRLPMANPDELGFPDAIFMEFDAIVAFDHVHHTLALVAEVHCDDGDNPTVLYDRARAAIVDLAEALRRPLSAPARKGPQSFVTPRPTQAAAEFERAVHRAREYIEAGDCQQIVLSQRFDAEIDIDPFAIYRSLRRINPSPYLFFLEHAGYALVGSSPEALVRVRDGEVTLRPIAGTRRRGRTPEEDAELEAELLADPKENAEHIMLVDLARNDVGRVAEVGSVRVDTLRSVERYSHVIHLVSQVRGRLAPGLDAVSALRAAFPAGTVSGSPKVHAMELIDELEPARRGPYAGCVGYFSRSGNMDMAITIRTLLHTAGRISVQAGAGIVYDSDPATEQAETVHKAQALFAAVARAQQVGGESRS